MRVTLDDEVIQILERLFGARARDFLALHETAQYLDHFDIEQMRCMHALCVGEGALDQSSGPRSVQ